MSIIGFNSFLKVLTARWYSSLNCRGIPLFHHQASSFWPEIPAILCKSVSLFYGRHKMLCRLHL